MNTVSNSFYYRGQVILHLDTFYHIIEEVVREDEKELTVRLMDSELVYTFSKDAFRLVSEKESLEAYARYSFALRDRAYLELYEGDIVRIFGTQHEFLRQDIEGDYHVRDLHTGREKVFGASTIIFLPYD